MKQSEFSSPEPKCDPKCSKRQSRNMPALRSVKEQYHQIFLVSHEGEIKKMFERIAE